MIEYSSESQYVRDLEERGKLPAGFRAGVAGFDFIPWERPQGGAQKMNLSLIRLDRPTRDFAGVFTRNLFPGYPVILGRERLAGEFARGVLINNRIANVGGPGGLEDAREILDCLEELDRTGGISGEGGADPGGSGEGGGYFAASTGIIGWRLPAEEMRQALPELAASLSGDSLVPVARGIMTTDAFPKLRSAALGGGRIVAAAKGAGMIEPNMATMLGFILTDLAVPREELRRILPEAAGRTFNRISVDGDQSTSDMLLAFSSGLAGPVAAGDFREALEEICAGLAEDIVRNGEGCTHVIRVRLSGCPDEKAAVKLAKGVANSPLVKTAVAGNDPNVGRILSALGDCAGNEGLALDPGRLRLAMGGEELFRDGRFELDPKKEERLVRYLRDAGMTPGHRGYPEHFRTVDIHADLGMGTAGAQVLAGDLTHEYVSENADYRS